MGKPVFVSIVYEDKKNYVEHTLDNWKKQGFIPTVEFVKEKHDHSDKSDNEIKDYLGKLIDSSQVVVFIIGKDTHSKRWIEWEYQYALNSDRKVVFMHIKGCPKNLPPLFPRKPTLRLRLKHFREFV